jgi:hypothetical protein
VANHPRVIGIEKGQGTMLEGIIEAKTLYNLLVR